MTDAQPDSLAHSLAQLHAELARAPRLDENAKQHLRAALAEIEQRIHEAGEPPVTGGRPPRASTHPLEALAVGFEADHPSLAASVRQFIDLLGQAGL
jgi:hypothetical protein